MEALMTKNPSKEIVEVHNLNDAPYIEEWKEEVINIPAHGCLKMKRRKAVSFLGSYPANLKDGSARVKMLEMRRPGQNIPAGVDQELVPVEYVCHLDGKTFDTKIQLDNHLKQFESQTVIPPEIVMCPICQVELENNDVFMKHLEIHKETLKEQKPFKLPKNGKGKK